MDSLGAQIREYRIRNGITQAEMARRCGLTRATICMMESGKYHRPNFVTLHKVNKVLEEQGGERE